MEYNITITKAEYDAEFTATINRLNVDKQVKHNITFRKFVADYGREEGIKKFKAAYYPSPITCGKLYHDIISEILYQEKYMTLCCDKKKAVDSMVQTNTQAQLDQYITDNGNPTIVQDKVNITVEA